MYRSDRFTVESDGYEAVIRKAVTEWKRGIKRAKEVGDEK